jgi:PPOX class probable F420-dependent enzyme
MNASEARERFSVARVARLATVGAWPHLVPITFAVLADRAIVSAIDHKPKRTVVLRRVQNIAANPRVAVLADYYDDDWATLWWVRADGIARVLAAGEERDLRQRAVAALVSKYAQYRARPPSGALVVIHVERWSGWDAKSN